MTQKLWLELTHQQRVALSQGESVVVSIPCERFMLVEKDPTLRKVLDAVSSEQASGMTYAELLKPENRGKLRKYLADKPDELEQLRQAHFKNQGGQ